MRFHAHLKLWKLSTSNVRIACLSQSRVMLLTVALEGHLIGSLGKQPVTQMIPKETSPLLIPHTLKVEHHISDA